MIPKKTVDWLAWGTKTLKMAGIDSPRRDARLLLAHAIGQSIEWIVAHPDTPLCNMAEFRNFVVRRQLKEPVSRIVGEREFWSLPFHVSPKTLDPRPDSETLVVEALDCFSDTSQPLRILDLGTGCGCLLLSILHERSRAVGIGVDRSLAALHVARLNAENLKLSNRALFVNSDWAVCLSGAFDLVISNPPYICQNEIQYLEPEVSLFDPRLALDGGIDGLECFRLIAAQIPLVFDKNSRLIVEVGEGQMEAAIAIFSDAGFNSIGCRRDLSGIQRCLSATDWQSEDG